jgi:CRISPR system Cascade subunit CasE
MPDAARLPEGFLEPRLGPDAFATKDLGAVVAAIHPGATFRFRLRANATRRVDTKTGSDGKRRNGKRVPVRGDEGRLAWLTSRLGVHGMRLLGGCDVRPAGTTVGFAAGRARTHEGCLYDGVLEVVDADLARRALAAGIGPAKAYGFGLLSLARVD